MLKKQALANIAAAGTDTSVIAAVPGRRIRVHSMAMQPGGTATNITFNSKGSGSGVAISCLFANGINLMATLPYNPDGWFDTLAGEALTATTGAGATTGLMIGYALLQ